MSIVLRLGLPLLVVGAVLLALVVFVSQSGESVRTAQQQGNDEQTLRLANLAGQCSSSVADNGYGTFEIDRDILISNEEGEISVPCNIRLKTGGSLTFDNVELDSDSLVISDFEPNGESRVTIRNSSFIGGEKAGLLMQLSDSADSVVIEEATIDYPLAVWVRVVGTAEGSGDGGSVEATSTTLRSLGAETDGIQLVAGERTGTGNFVDLKLETVPLASDLDPDAKRVILLAGDCHVERIEGYQGVCDPEDAAALEQR